MKYIDLIRECNSRDLKRAYNSTKEYFYFQFNVFNGGISSYITCTNKEVKIDESIWNGYDFVALNDECFKDILLEVLKEKNEELNEILG